MESTSRATATGSRPLGTALLRVSVMARMPTSSSPVPITCGASTAAQRHGEQHCRGRLGRATTSTHLIEETVGEGDVVSGVGGKNRGRFPGARGGEGPVAVVVDGVCGAEAEPGHPSPATALPCRAPTPSRYRGRGRRQLRRRRRLPRSARPRRWETSTRDTAPAGTWRGRTPGSGGPLQERGEGLEQRGPAHLESGDSGSWDPLPSLTGDSPRYVDSHHDGQGTRQVGGEDVSLRLRAGDRLRRAAQGDQLQKTDTAPLWTPQTLTETLLPLLTPRATAPPCCGCWWH